jgi:hypothetical protein
MTVQEKFSKELPINHGSKCDWSDVTPGERSSEETDGTYTRLEIVVDHRNGTPMHVHQNEDEPFIILEDMAQGHRKAVCWLISLAALVCLLVGILCLVESATRRMASADQLRFAAGGEPNQAGIALGQLSRRSVFDISRSAGTKKSDFTSFVN